MANGPVVDDLRRFLQERVASSGSADPVRADLERFIASRSDSGEGSGLIERAGEFFRNIFVDPDVGTEDQFRFGISERDRAQLATMAAGLASPVLSAFEAVSQIPGLFADQPIATDKAADFFRRADIGLTTQAEQAALEAGLSPTQIADSHLFGEIVGYTAPVVASLKVAQLVTGVRGPVTGLARNFILDTTAGAIFGGVLLPEEELAQRGVNILRESAIFGIGGLAINGLIFAANGVIRGRADRLAAGKGLDETLARIRRGEQVELGPNNHVEMAQLMSEEGFLATSPEAYALLQAREAEGALVQAIEGTAELGESAGIVRSFGSSFDDISRTIERFRSQFPGFKFEAVRRGDAFDLYYGTKGLNNQQRAQLKRDGRYSGMMVEKNGTRYEYVRPGREGQLVVRTQDGKVVHIKEEGVTDLLVGREEITLPTTGEALYDDFREFVLGRMDEAALASGSLPEEQVIRGIREGTLTFGDDAARVFDDGGAITHPDELGFAGAGIRVTSETNGVSIDYYITRNTTPGEGRWRITADDGQVVGPHVSYATPEEALSVFQGENVTNVQAFNPTGSTDEFVQAFLREGIEAGQLLPPTPIRRFEDAFQEWLEARSLTPDAADVEAFRESFAQRLRNDLWRQVPEEDLAIFQQIREETLDMIEQEGLPLEALAHMKGFHVDRLADERVILRDINTGARLTYGSERTASEALAHVIRAEKDPLSLYISPGAHGMPGLTGGFRNVDDVWTFGDNIAAREFEFRTPISGITNRRDYFIRIEEASGIPLFSKGFGPLDEAMLRLKQRQEPISDRIAEAWKGIKVKQRIEVAEFWNDIEGMDISINQAVRLGRRRGLSSKQIQAFVKSRALFDMGAQMMGLPRSRFIRNYYSRIRPAFDEGGNPNIRRLLSDDPTALREFEFWAERPRTGELAQKELDPEIVMHKHFRGLLYSQEVAPIESELRKLLLMRIKDLDPAKQSAVLQRALPGTTKDSFVLPDDVRAVLTEYINNIRGNVAPGFATARRFTTRLFELLGMKVDLALFDELHGLYLTAQYGAAIGLRPMMLNRNAVQNVWTMYTRVGGRHGTNSLRRSLTQAGYDEALNAGAIRATEVSVPLGDALFENMIGNPEFVRGTGLLSNALAAGLRRGIRLGRVSRKVAQKFLVPYGSGDQINRAWAFHWQRMHSDDWLRKFEAGDISWDKFLDEGLPFFSGVIKDNFASRFQKFGRNRALDYVGKQAADEAHFIYGAAATPTWMQRPFGRLIGVFGQWPLWAKELYFRRMASGTRSQMAKFWVRNLAVMGAFANMTAQTGISMWNWLAPLSFTYAGGPFVDTLEDARRVIEGPMDQRAGAARRMAENIGSLSVPGQVFIREVGDFLDESDPAQAALLLMLGRPANRGNFAFDFIYTPETLDLYDSSEGRRPLGGLPLINR